MRTPVVAALALAAVACQPWYRDDLRRGRMARDHVRITRMLDEAKTLHGKGRSADAAARVWEVIERDPFQPADTYVAYATYEAAAGRGDRARDVITWRMTRDSSSALRAFLVTSFAEDQRIADALDAAKVTTLSAAAALPALAPQLADLVDADTRRTADPAGALAMYLAWLRRYGVPDHALLIEARARIMESAWSMVRWSAACGTPLPPVLAGMAALADAQVPPEPAAARALYTLGHQLDGFAQLPAAIEQAGTYDTPGGEGAPVQLAAQGDAAADRGRLGEAVALYRRVVALAPWWLAARDNLDALQAKLGRGALAYPVATGTRVAPLERELACTTAAQHYDRRCRAGEASACTILAPLLAQGVGTARDEERACSLGDGATCRALGRRHQRARTAVAADAAAADVARTRAAKLAKPAAKPPKKPVAPAVPPVDARTRCDGGDGHACLELAVGADADALRARARSLFDAACTGGAHDACAALTAWLLVEPELDGVRARTLLQRACDAGSLDGCARLADLLDKGVPESRAISEANSRARGYYRRACEAKDADGCTLLRELGD